MTANPFTEKIEALQQKREEVSSQLLHWKTTLAWFHGFNIDQASLNAQRTERTVADVQAKLLPAQQRLTSLESSAKELEAVASMGFDPRYWFSSERAVAKRKLSGAMQELIEQRSRVAGMKAEVSKAMELSRKLQSEIAMARTFDPLLAQSAIPAQQAILDRMQTELASLQQRSAQLDKALRAPLDDLRRHMAEQNLLISKISRAEAFEAELSNASNSYERALIHSRCGNDLGDSKPGNVLKESRGALRRIDNIVAKLQTRVDSLIRAATLDIGHIVIDANNLCYEGRRFLKLAALEALVPILTRKYKVTLIFDASIRRKLGLSNEDIAARFSTAERVHVVASNRKADETVLAVAGDDPHTFVLSNDRFVDFPDMVTVTEERVLRHEIVGQIVYIHDLQIEAKFENEPGAEAA